MMTTGYQSGPAPSSTPRSISGTTYRMHVALHVRDVEHSIAFYAALFGEPPVKTRSDYGKFVIENPNLSLTLNASSSLGKPGALSHLGFQVEDDAALEEARAAVLHAGLEVELDEPGVSCCHALQNKFWVVDPDGNAWEFYRFIEDVDESVSDARLSGGFCCAGPRELPEVEVAAVETGACCADPETCCS